VINMTKRLTKAQRTIKVWAEAMRPFAERHKNPEKFRLSISRENGYEESYSQDRDRVSFQNLRDFGLMADYDGGGYIGKVGEARNSLFCYTRGILPFGDNDGEKDNNAVVAVRLAIPIFDWARALNFQVRVDSRSSFGNLYASEPVISFEGRIPAERFQDYLDLVTQVERHVDWGLQLVDRDMSRPFKYALVEQPHHGSDSTKVGVYKPMQSVADLEGARCVLVAARSMHESGFTTPFIRQDANIVDDAQRILGKVLTVEEFLKSATK